MWLQQQIKGQRRRVNRRPEVHLTIHEFEIGSEGALELSLQEFSMSGVRVTALVEITGSQSQIAKELGQEAAKKLLRKASSLVGFGGKSTSSSSSSNREKATLVGKARSEGDLDLEGPEANKEAIQTCHVELTLNVAKKADSEKVKVEIRDLVVGESSFVSASTAKAVLGNKRLRSFIEAGVSQIVQKALTKKLQKVKRSAFQKACCCLLRCFKTSNGVPEV